MKNQVFIVVGGTTGIGLAAAKALQQNGARLVIIGLDDDSCKETKRLFTPDEVVVLQGDACKSQTIEQAIEIADSNLGVINGLFHVAGGSGRKFGDGPLHEITDSAWDKTLELNLKSVMISNRAIINYFKKNNIPGTILNTGSVLAASPSSKYFTTHGYAAAKSALVGFSKSIASYYAEENIRVNVISPGLINTPMAQRAVKDEKISNFLRTKQPLDGGGEGNPEDLISAVLMFLSPESKFITGQELMVEGGWMLSDGQY